MTNDESNMNAILRAGILSSLIPIGVFAGIYLYGNFLLLDYIHVLLGAIWTGVDVFYGLIFISVLSTIDYESKIHIAKRILPMTLFFIPTTSILTPLAGYFLATREGIFDIYSPIFTWVIIIGSILVILGFATILSTSIIIYRSFRNGKIDGKRISRLLIIGSRGALGQLVLQVVIISLMAYLVVF